MSTEVTAEYASSRSAVRDYIVEFLGSLVPGVAFLLAFVPAFVLPVGFAILATFGVDLSALPWMQDIPASVGTIIFLLLPAFLAFLVFAYIAGHLFYRQDPKSADVASFDKIPRHIQHDGMVRPVKGGGIPVEFPYHFLKQYLLDRGLDYLAQHVPWTQDDFKRRAKHYANALKVRVHIERPAHFGTLARNEAHVRLSSSMWYVCKVILWASLIGFVTCVSAIVGSRLTDSVEEVVISPIVTLPILTGLAACLVKWAIERALHYQREREVLFILETAHWLCISGRAPRIFEGLEGRKGKPKRKRKRKRCKRKKRRW